MVISDGVRPHRDAARDVGPLDLVAAIDATWFGAGLPEASRERLALLAHTFEAPAGTRLLVEATETRELGLVLAGRLVLRTSTLAGGSTSLLTIDPGDIYGWSAILPPFLATSTVVALEPVRILAFEGARLRAALRRDHELAANLYQQVLEAVVRRLDATRHHESGTARGR